MPRSLLEDAFAHHAWATLRLIDACRALMPDQLATAVPGTDRSILQTLQHIVGGDSFDHYVLTRGTTPFIDPADLDLDDLQAAMEVIAGQWLSLLEDDLDAREVVREVDPDDGYQRDAPLGMRLAAALHHGSDHRAQICTALALLGIAPPDLSVWAFGLEIGQITEVYPTAP